MALIALVGVVALAPSPLEKIEETAHAETKPNISAKEEIKKDSKKVVAEPALKELPKFDPKDASTWPKCAKDEIVRADNGKCHKKAIRAVSATPKATTGSGDCVSEIKKYDWSHSTAIAVAQAESGLRTWIVNDNPRTRDYSIGCFQINIYGANARSRPSEAALKDAATNVAFAYKLYVGNKNSFLGQWGVCGLKVACY